MTKWRRFLLAIALLLPTSATAQKPSPSDALALEQQGKLEEAAGAWRSVTQRNPKDAAAFGSLGVVLSKQQKYQEAASAYKKALALNPKRSEEHTSELQSRLHLVCRLLLEKKNHADNDDTGQDVLAGVVGYFPEFERQPRTGALRRWLLHLYVALLRDLWMGTAAQAHAIVC